MAGACTENVTGLVGSEGADSTKLLATVGLAELGVAAPGVEELSPEPVWDILVGLGVAVSDSPDELEHATAMTVIITVRINKNVVRLKLATPLISL